MTYIIYHVRTNFSYPHLCWSLINFFHCLQWIPPWILKSLSKSLWFLWFLCLLMSPSTTAVDAITTEMVPMKFLNTSTVSPLKQPHDLKSRLLFCLYLNWTFKARKPSRTSTRFMRCTEQPFLFFFQVVVRTQKFFYLILSLKNILWCCGRRFLELV